MPTRTQLATTAATLARDLDDARRMGQSEDRPEGVRYILLSDTSARTLANQLRALAGALKGKD